MSTPQERYITSLSRKIDNLGRQVYRSVIPKKIEPNNATDIQITATDGARMDVLAQQRFGNAESWWAIASANGKVNGSLYFAPGTKIFIPLRK